MSIKPQPQRIIVWSEQFAVTLVADGLNPEAGVMRVLVDGQPQCFRFSTASPCANEQNVTVVGTSPVIVCAGWGAGPGPGKALVVEVTSAGVTTQSAPPRPIHSSS